MQEEVKRIEQVKQLEQRRAAATSTDLTGQQLFIRSCNTCHPSGRAGVGPSLAAMNDHFPSDKALREFIRKGKGIMPGQPKETLNDKELDSLVAYLRALKI
jgi:mono/diheme cytochrome c family protein